MSEVTTVWPATTSQSAVPSWASSPHSWTVTDAVAGKCTPVNDFNKQSGFGLFCNAQGKKAYKGFKVIGTEAFGPGAVIEYTDAEVQKTPKQTPTPGVQTHGKANTGVYTAALDQNGHYQLTGPVSPIISGSVIGTKPTNDTTASGNNPVTARCTGHVSHHVPIHNSSPRPQRTA